MYNTFIITFSLWYSHIKSHTRTSGHICFENSLFNGKTVGVFSQSWSLLDIATVLSQQEYLKDSGGSLSDIYYPTLQ